MAIKPVPDGYHSITPYLVVKGASKLIDLIKNAFGGAEVFPPMRAPDGAVMHAELRIGDSVVMMGEAGAQFPPTPAMLHYYVPDVDTVYKRALALGCVSVREPSDQFYGDRSGGVKDPFGNIWWIATHVEDVSPEELERRAAALHK